ncbi:MAG: hypothetical protein AAGE18_05745 [Pseudomonadota bacterium]
MNFIGATIIAGLIYFLLSFLSALLLDGPQVTTTAALLSALIKTAVFVVLFHYVHRFFARMFGWYEDDEAPAIEHDMDYDDGSDFGDRR